MSRQRDRNKNLPQATMRWKREISDVGDTVKITGGKYKGNTAVVYRFTEHMVVVRLVPTGEEVRIQQKNVRNVELDGTASARTTEMKVPLNAKHQEKVIQLLREELHEVRDRIRELSFLLETLNLHKAGD